MMIGGCIHHRRGTNIHFGFVFIPFSASLNTEKTYMHDDHIHDEFCNHPRKWFDGRWVYYYNGNWEFYNYDEKVYYYIPKEIIENYNE